MTPAWFFGRLVPMVLAELSDALRSSEVYDDVTDNEEPDVAGLIVLLQSASQLSLRIAMRGTPMVDVVCPESKVLCICGHRRRVHETSSPHACHGMQPEMRAATRCDCKSFTASEPAYVRPTDRPPPPPKGDPTE